jgi:hypothetical protein
MLLSSFDDSKLNTHFPKQVINLTMMPSGGSLRASFGLT